MFDPTIHNELQIQHKSLSEKSLIENIAHSIKNYIECLLNTRRSYFEHPLEAFELDNSLLDYGLPDLRHFNLRSKNDIQRLCLMIESVIETHESRLKSVRVSLVENNHADDHTNVLLCIKATLLHNLSEKEVEFFSEFNRVSQIFLVKDC
jgi:type VI secretion system lysozyme-like protein